MSNSTVIVQVQATTKERCNYLGANIGVKVKEIDSRESYWFNHYEFETRPVVYGGYYKINPATGKVLARVKRK